jgi:hypothetical protein
MFEIVSTLTIPAENPAECRRIHRIRSRSRAASPSARRGQARLRILFAALIGRSTGVPVQTVQYRGSSQAMTDLAGGHRCRLSTYALGQPFIAEKRSSRSRLPPTKRWSEFPACRSLRPAGQAHGRDVVRPAGAGRHPAPSLQARRSTKQSCASRDPSWCGA